jgi:hypothetical protein
MLNPDRVGSSLFRRTILPLLGYAWIVAMLPWAFIYRLCGRIRAARPIAGLPVGYILILSFGVLLTLGFDLVLVWSAGRLIWSVL